METPAYKMVSTSAVSSKIEDIELSQSESGLTRKVIRAEVVKNVAATENSVKFAIVHQRRAKDQPWEDLGGTTLAQLKAGEAAKMPLDTVETKALVEHLENLYEIGKGGVRTGVSVLTVAQEDEVIKTTTSRARFVKKLLEANHGAEVWEALIQEDPNLATRLALSHVYEDRKKVVDEIAANISKVMGEEYWQKLLERNRWIFGNCYVGFVEERRINIKSTLDHPLIGEDGALEVVEIKRPEFKFWAHKRDGSLFKYRDKYLLPSTELQGAITQGANYILELEKQVDSKDWAANHDGICPLKPKCLIVHGRSEGWSEVETRDFRLLNDRLHGITVITFDHLLSRARQALDVLKPI